jgi:hypothetical protein
MPSRSAAAVAVEGSRDAIATSSHRSAVRIPGITLLTPMFAVESTPQRTLATRLLLRLAAAAPSAADAEG